MNTNGKQARKRTGLTRFQIHKATHKHKRAGKVFEESVKSEKIKQASTMK